MREVFKKIGLLVFVSLIFFKVSAFHIYEHEAHAADSADHCEFCLIALENQHSPFELATTATTCPERFFKKVEVFIPEYCNRFLNKPYNFYLHSRPPPVA